MRPFLFEMLDVPGNGCPVIVGGGFMADAGRHHGGGAWVSASEVASFAYCPEQWRLEQGLKLDASNQVERRAGIRHHARKAGQERLAGGMLLLARLLAVALLVGAFYLFVVSRSGR